MKAILPELECAFSSLNSSLFGGVLRRPKFVLAPHKKVIIRFVPEDFEMTIGCDIAKVDDESCLMHLLHEMVHVSNFQKGIVDCRHGRYHNAKFRAAALAVGLVVNRDPTHGWGITVLESNVANKVEPPLDARKRREEAFKRAKLNQEVLRDVQKKVSFSQKPSQKRTFFLKYECNCAPPHNSIRSGRRPDGEHPLNIKCMYCNSYFRCMEIT